MEPGHPRATRPTVGLLSIGTERAWHRAASLLRRVRSPVVALSPTPAPPRLADRLRAERLPLEGSGGEGSGTPQLGTSGMRVLAAWLDTYRPAIVLADGLPCTALQVRLAGVTVVPIRGFGHLGEPWGRALDDGAGAWLAPYPAALEPPDTPSVVRARTVHTGFLSRFEGRRMGRAAARRRLGIDRHARHATVLAPAGGLDTAPRSVTAIAAAARSWSLSVIGRLHPDDDPSAEAARVHRAPAGTDPYPHLAAADVVITGASTEPFADAATVGCPVAVVTGPRPVPDAAARFAEALEATGAACVLQRLPEPVAWPALLADLLDQDTAALHRLDERRGGSRAADWIETWARTPPVDAITASSAVLGRPTARSVRDPSPAAVATGRVDHLGAVAEP